MNGQNHSNGKLKHKMKLMSIHTPMCYWLADVHLQPDSFRGLLPQMEHPVYQVMANTHGLGR